MKQANVTRKNRKVRLLRAIYPHVNIQVFYQKDVQDLVMKYRSPERVPRGIDPRLTGSFSQRRRSIGESVRWPRRFRRNTRGGSSS